MLRIAYHTVGCRLNQTETDEAANALNIPGVQEVLFTEKADVYIINSCTVTEKSHQKSLKAVRQAAKINPEALIVAAGCAVSYDRASFADIKGVDLLFSAQDKIAIVEEVLKRLKPDEKEVKEVLDIPKSRRARTRAYLKIQDGCDLECSFCIVTIVRGEPVSYSREDVLEDAQQLVEKGYKEIVLTGVNLGSYSFDGTVTGHIPFDSTVKIPLQELLEEILTLGEGFRLRLSSINPENVNKGLIDFLDEEPRMCKHLHISLQTVSNRILESMKRPYDKKRISETFEYLEQTKNRFGIGSDMLIGFPGETEEDFQEVCTFVQENSFTYLHVFPFSARKQTTASDMQGKVDQGIIQQRVKKLKEITVMKKAVFLRSLIGQNIEVLFETKKEGKLTGTASNFTKVQAPADAGSTNEIVNLPVRDATEEVVLI